GHGHGHCRRPVLAIAVRSLSSSSPSAVQHHDHHHAPLQDPSHPPTAAYYTGNAKYYDLLYSIQSQLGGIQVAAAAAAHIAANPHAYDAVRKSFKSRDTLDQEMHLTLSERQYDHLVAHLTALRLGGSHAAAAKLVAVALASHAPVMPQETKSFLSPFLNPAAVAAERTKLKKPDAFGRSFGTGSRKTSRAHAWVVPGDGQVCINGVPVANYFLRREVEALTYPLQVAQAFGKYNVWVVAQGGGTTGQAEAGAVAVARALCVHEPELKDEFDLVERKKPGQKKARKKFAWVKR
ncbi:ribosomal protein S5 domain 2-type protein, partial [Catenaria anguillulae PL171]